MRLLHTGDWHLGKRLYGSDRTGEARAALEEVARIAAAEAVDAVLVAGDLLDRRLVDSAALGDCLGALERLAAVAPVLAVAGNHDDPALWNHLAPYLAGRRIHVTGRVRPVADAVVTIATAAGPLHAAMQPWPDPARDLPALNAEWTARQGRELGPAQAAAFALAIAEGAEEADG